MIEIQKKWYTVDQCRNYPEKYFVFGDNTQRVGSGGQAKIRHEVNAVGVVTKWSPGISEDAYFDESIHSPFTLISLVSEDLARVERLLKDGSIVVWPADNIGTGLAQLPKRAPNTMDFICRSLASICVLYGVEYT